MHIILLCMDMLDQKTELTVYRHHPHGFSNFLKRLYTATIWHFGPAPSSAAIEGRRLSDWSSNLTFLALFEI